MYHDVQHEANCHGMHCPAPQMRDCTCGKIIDCLLAEREHLQKTLDDLYDGRTAVIPKTRAHAEHLLLVAETMIYGNKHIEPMKPKD